MNYNISSKKLHDPLIKDILSQLTKYFSETTLQFYVIGATARDIIMNIHNEKALRATRDLDIAIAVSGWDEYKNIETDILNIPDFKKDKNQKQRFIFKDVFELDIVPFGDIKKQDDKIFWPPDETVAMSVLGFSEVANNTEKVTIDNDLSIEIASLAGIFILKIVAWNDRNSLSNKDADDMAFIISNYLSINEKRASGKYYDKIYLDETFSINSGGAKLLGIDINEILSISAETKQKIKLIIEKETEKEHESRLINQMIETNPNFGYDEILFCFENIVEELKD